MTSQILPISDILRKLMCVRNDIECPLCHDKGTYEFVQAECMHHFCIRCFKKQQKESKRKKSTHKQCPMCLLDFQKMYHPRTTKSFSQLFKEIQSVGKGAFGEAVLVYSKEDPTKIFIAKKIRLKKVGEDGISQSQLLEADLLRQLSSDYVVQYTNQFMEKNQCIIVMEYCQLGDLKYQISQQKKLNQQYTESQVMYWFCQLVLSLKDIHQEHIMHRDIKSENVFISEGNIAKIGDFGISKVNKDGTLGKGEMVGTYEYMAPEIVHCLQYTYKADVWSLGIILYQLCALQVPFRADNPFALQIQIMDREKEMEPIPSIYSKDLQDLVNFILNKDEEKRPDIAELQKHKYVQAQMEKFYGNELEGPEIHLKNDQKSKDLREKLSKIQAGNNEEKEEPKSQKKLVEKKVEKKDDQSDDFDDINDDRDDTKLNTKVKRSTKGKTNILESEDDFNGSRDDTKTNGQITTQFFKNTKGRPESDSDFEGNDSRDESHTVGQKTTEVKENLKALVKKNTQPMSGTIDRTDFDDSFEGNMREPDSIQSPEKMQFGGIHQSAIQSEGSFDDRDSSQTNENQSKANSNNPMPQLEQVACPIQFGMGVNAEMVAENLDDRTYKFDKSIIGSDLKLTKKPSEKQNQYGQRSHETKNIVALTPAQIDPSPVSRPLSSDEDFNERSRDDSHTIRQKISEHKSQLRSDLNSDLSPLMTDPQDPQQQAIKQLHRQSKLFRSRSRGESFSRGRSSKRILIQEAQAQDLPPVNEEREEDNKMTITEKPEPIKLEDLQEFNVFKFNDANLEKRLEQLENLQDEQKKQEVTKEKKEESEFEYDSEEWENYLAGSSEEASEYEEDYELEKIKKARAANENKNNPIFHKQQNQMIQQQQYGRQDCLSANSMTDNEDQTSFHNDKKNFDYPTVPLILTYGNTHADIEIPQFIQDALEKKKMKLKDHHRWMMFVYLDEGKKAMTHKAIQHVRFKCNPPMSQFQMNEKIVEPPFILSKTTITPYTVKIKVTFKSWTKLPPLRLSHQLNFDQTGMGGNKSYEIFVPKDSYVQNMVMDQYKAEQEVEEQISDKRKNRIHLKMGIESEEIYGAVSKTLSPRNKKSTKKNVAVAQPPPEYTEEEISKKQVKKWTVFVELDQMMGELFRIKDFIQKVKFSFERDHLEDNIIVTESTQNLKRFEFTKTRPKSQFAITYIIHFNPILRMKPHVFKIGNYTDEADKTQMIKIPKVVFSQLMAKIRHMRKGQKINTLVDDQQDVVALLNMKLNSNTNEDGKKIKEPITHIVPSHIQNRYVRKHTDIKMKFEDYLAFLGRRVITQRQKYTADFQREQERLQAMKQGTDLDHFFYVPNSAERQKEFVPKSIIPELERDSARGLEEQKNSYFMYRQTKSGDYIKIEKQKKLDADFSYRSPIKQSKIQTIDIQVNLDLNENERGSVGSPRRQNNSQSPDHQGETRNSQRSVMSNDSMVKQPQVKVSSYLKWRQQKYRKKYRNNQQQMATVIPVQEAKKMAETIVPPQQNIFQPSIATLSGRFNRFAKSAKKRNKNLSYCNSSMLSELKETEQSWAAVLNMVHGGTQSIANLKVDNPLVIQKVPQSPRTSRNPDQNKESWAQKRSVVMSTSNLDQTGIKSGQTVFKDKLSKTKVKLNGQQLSESRNSYQTTEKFSPSNHRLKETIKTLDQESFFQKQRPKTGNTFGNPRNLNSAQKLKQSIELANRQDQSQIHQVMANTLQNQQVKEMTQNFVKLNDMGEQQNEQFLQVPLSSRVHIPTTQNLLYNHSIPSSSNNHDHQQQKITRSSVKLSQKFDKLKNLSNRESGRGEVPLSPTENTDVFNDCINSRQLTDPDQEAPHSSQSKNPSQRSDQVVIQHSSNSQYRNSIIVSTSTRKSIMEDVGHVSLQKSRSNAIDIQRKMDFTNKIEKVIKRHHIRQDRHGISSKKKEPVPNAKPKMKNRAQARQHCLRVERFDQHQVQALSSSFKGAKQKEKSPLNSAREFSQTLGRNTLSKINETEMIDQMKERSDDEEEEDTCANKSATANSYNLKQALMSPKLMRINAMSMNILNSQIHRDYAMIHELRNKMQDQ